MKVRQLGWWEAMGGCCSFAFTVKWFCSKSTQLCHLIFCSVWTVLKQFSISENIIVSGALATWRLSYFITLWVLEATFTYLMLVSWIFVLGLRQEGITSGCPWNFILLVTRWLSCKRTLLTSSLSWNHNISTYRSLSDVVLSNYWFDKLS